MGKSTISMAIFNSDVSLPEGIPLNHHWNPIKSPFSIIFQPFSIAFSMVSPGKMGFLWTKDGFQARLWEVSRRSRYCAGGDQAPWKQMLTVKALEKYQLYMVIVIYLDGDVSFHFYGYIYMYGYIWIYNTFRVITDLKLVFRAITWGWWFCSVLLVKWFKGPRWSRKMETAWSGIFVDAGWYFGILGIYIIYCHIHLRKDPNLSLS